MLLILITHLKSLKRWEIMKKYKKEGKKFIYKEWKKNNKYIMIRNKESRLMNLKLKLSLKKKIFLICPSFNNLQINK